MIICKEILITSAWDGQSEITFSVCYNVKGWKALYKPVVNLKFLNIKQTEKCTNSNIN